MKFTRQTMLSILALTAAILALTATGALAVHLEEPAASRPAGEAQLGDDNPRQPGDRYRVEFLSGCGHAGSCPAAPVAVYSGENAPEPDANTYITVAKNNDTPSPIDFEFTSTALGAFLLDDADPDDGDAIASSKLFTVTALVEYDITETPVWNADLSSIVCVYSDIGTDVAAIFDEGTLLGVTITPAEADDITCTYNNELTPFESFFLPFIAAD